MLDRNRFENSRPDGFPVLEIVEESERAAPRRFVPLQRTELTGRVAGPLADLELKQTFRFSREDHKKPIEALYRFPLPGDAAVTGVTVRFGDVEILSELKERGKAEEEYEAAKKEGRQAALTTRESPDVFTLSVTGIEPDTDVLVATRFVQLARPEGAGWSLRIPLTTSPRFVREDETGSRHAKGQPLAILRDPGHRFSLDLALEGAAAVSSPTHAVSVSGAGGTATVRLQDGESIPDRDCVLTWAPSREEGRPAVDLFTHRDSASGQVYFLAQVSPASSRAAQPSVAREVVLLVDHSGSMDGAKWEAADWAVKKFLLGLTEADAFHLCLFHDTTLWLSREPLRGGQDEIKKAVTFLEKHHESGGTNLGVALEQALERPHAPGDRSRHLLIITDAEVSDSGRILRLARAEYNRPERRRISVLCIDAAPNALLASELAETGGGVARFLTSSPEEGDITTALDEILEDWSSPVLADVKLELDRPKVESAGRRSVASSRNGWSAVDLGDVPAGRILWVAGRTTVGANGVNYRVTSGNHEIAFGQVAGDAAQHWAIKPLFGARRVLALENLAHGSFDHDALETALRGLGYDPKQIGQKKGFFGVYNENKLKASQEAVRELLVRESLEFGIASSETAFVATRTEKGRKSKAAVIVPNALPHGWSDRFAGGMALACSLAAPAQASIGGMVHSARTRHIPMSAKAPTYGSLHDSFVVGDAAENVYDSGSDLEEMTRTSARRGGRSVFEGVPSFCKGEAILVDESAATGSAMVRLSELRLAFPVGEPASLGPNLVLLLYVGDLNTPRARIRLSDLARQGWTRPLNITRRPGEPLRLVLADPDGEWAATAPELEVHLG